MYGMGGAYLFRFIAIGLGTYLLTILADQSDWCGVSCLDECQLFL